MGPTCPDIVVMSVEPLCRLEQYVQYRLIAV